MAKGRRLTTSRSERFFGSNGQGIVNSGSELREDEVWSMVDDMVNGDDQSSSIDNSQGGWSPRAVSESNGSLMMMSSGRRGSETHGQVGGLSLAFEDSGNKTTSSRRIVHQFRAHDGSVSVPRVRQIASSAPQNVPDWSKIYRADSMESIHDSSDGIGDSSESDWVPPHEYVAREYARSRGTAENSVFQGVGRTLKGRDMSRVRDAVWSQTGFDG